MKAIIFDSSTIITLAMNGLLDVLRNLRKNFSGKFIITRDVRYETVERPAQIKRFELGALQISELINEKILELPESLGIKDDELRERTRKILSLTNHTFFARNEFMRIIHDGEASCLALSAILSEKKVENIISIDERTTRMLVEKPDNLHELFEKKLHTSVKFDRRILLEGNFKCVRSSELVYFAWKKNLVEIQDKRILDALLYATKFKGSSISFEEIDELKKLG